MRKPCYRSYPALIFYSALSLISACAQQLTPPGVLVPTPVAHVPYESGPNGTRFYRRGGKSVVVFIHGVLGSPGATWLNDASGSYWPELLLADSAFRNFDVYVVGYNTPVFSSALNLEQLSGNLEVQLRAAGIFDYEAVHVVAHSMGGLIIKRILTGLAIEAPNELQKVRTVFLIATPNHGADVARLAQLFRSQNPQFGDMAERGSSFLEMVDNLWISLLVARPQHGTLWPQAYCAYETKPTFGIRVVTEESARTQCDNSPYALESDHLGVVKPVSYNFPPYPWMAYQVKKTIRDTNTVALPSLVTPTISEATLTQHLVTSRDTLIFIGRKDTTFTVSAVDCGKGCTRSGDDFFETTLRAPMEYVLTRPTLTCVDHCVSTRATDVEQNSRATATARVAVTAMTTTWRLSADLAQFRDILSFTDFPAQRVFAGQEVTVAFPGNATALQLTLSSALGTRVIDPTNLTGHEPFDLLTWNVDSAGTKTFRLRFNGRWEPQPTSTVIQGRAKND